MPWLLLDVAIALLAVGLLALAALRLWRRIKDFSRAVSAAGRTVGDATARLSAEQARAPRRD